jgi:Fe-S-cluster-containing hydrogenase component 2
MGHQFTADSDLTYQRLQERLDRLPTGAPDSAVFQRILRLLFTEDEAQVAAVMPTLGTLEQVATRTGRSVTQIEAMVEQMARKGLVFDLRHRDHRWVSLAPVVIGFYEFTFMRVREDAPTDELAVLFDDYLHKDGALAHAVFRGSTQIGRSLVREESLPENPAVEVLDWELATHIVAEAPSVAVGNCPCRQHAELLGRGCGAPLRTCLSFGSAADALVRAGHAEAITNEEGLGILAEAKAAGLAQTADNVQEHVTYMCNCCGDCCGMMQSIRRYGITGAIVSSNWVAHVDLEKCRGCKKCARACPAEAVTMVDNGGQGLRKYWAIVDTEKCLGCGVCDELCRFDAHSMIPRDKRVFTPANTFERLVAMAVERGKLGDLLVDQLDGAGPHAVARVLQVIEQLPRARAEGLVAPLRSVFLQGLLAAMHTSRTTMATP